MYQKRTNKQNSEDAVSPVVAVMLMLVVTIVIAALVAAFATGVLGDQKAAPVVTASVDLNTRDNTTTITFMSVSEPVAAKDLQLSLKSTKNVLNETSKKYEYRFFSQLETLGTAGSVTSGSSIVKVLALQQPGSEKNFTGDTLISSLTEHDAATWGKYFALYAKKNTTTTSGSDKRFDLFSYSSTGAKVTVELDIPENDPRITPMIKVQQQSSGPGDDGGSYKGNFLTCKPGYTFQKNVNIMQTVNIEELEAGDKVDVEIIHIPSNAVVYAKAITVGA